MLQTIIDHKVQELETRRRARPLTALRDAPLFAAARRDFAAALRAPGRRIIAEVKRASPSRGRIREDFDPVAIAAGYAAAGAAAVSVLTDERFFEGSLDDLTAVRERITIPVLRKDFLFEPYHLYEARAAGADAFLLIAAILTAEHLRELVALGAELGMTALVEVHTVEQIERARGAGVQVWGINNRDLDTLEVQLETGLELLRLLPADATPEQVGYGRIADLTWQHLVSLDACTKCGKCHVACPAPAAALRTLLQ